MIEITNIAKNRELDISFDNSSLQESLESRIYPHAFQ